MRYLSVCQHIVHHTKWSLKTENYFKNTTHYTKLCLSAHFFCLFMGKKRKIVGKSCVVCSVFKKNLRFLLIGIHCRVPKGTHIHCHLVPANELAGYPYLAPMGHNPISGKVMPLWGIIRTYGHQGGDVCTSGQGHIYVRAEMYIHKEGCVYT